MLEDIYWGAYFHSLKILMSVFLSCFSGFCRDIIKFLLDSQALTFPLFIVDSAKNHRSVLILRLKLLNFLKQAQILID